MKKRAKIILGIPTVIILILGAIATPTIWRYSSYRKARLTMESGDEAEAIRIITKLHKNPFFDLDWTIQGVVKKIPHGYICYEKLVGCPACRGDIRALIYYSARSGHLELTRKMIEMGADIELWDDKGLRLLQAAVFSRNLALVEYLINQGADVNALDPPSAPVFHFAVVVRSKPEMYDLLLSHGADINIENFNGWTPLDTACSNSTNAIPYLLNNGAEFGGNKKWIPPNLKEKIIQLTE